MLSWADAILELSGLMFPVEVSALSQDTVFEEIWSKELHELGYRVFQFENHLQGYFIQRSEFEKGGKIVILYFSISKIESTRLFFKVSNYIRADLDDPDFDPSDHAPADITIEKIGLGEFVGLLLSHAEVMKDE